MSYSPNWDAAAFHQCIAIPASSVQTGATDIATIAIPALWTSGAGFRVLNLHAYAASISLTIATVDLRTASGGGGSAIVSAGVLSGLTAATLTIPVTITLSTTIITATTLTLRCVTGQVAAATCKFLLEGLILP